MTWNEYGDPVYAPWSVDRPNEADRQTKVSLDLSQAGKQIDLGKRYKPAPDPRRGVSAVRQAMSVILTISRYLRSLRSFPSWEINNRQSESSTD